MRGPTAQRIAAPPGQVEVEIVDDDAAPLTQGATGRARRRPGGLSRRLRRRGAVLLVAVLAVAAVNVVEQRREAERVAAVAALPGVLDGVDGPLVPAWTVEGSQLTGLTAHLVVVWTREATLAVEPVTGEVAWRWPAETGVPGDAETCEPLRTPDPPELPARPLAGPVLTGPPGDPPGALVACVRETPAVRDDGRVVTQQVRVSLLDADDGTPQHGWTTRGRTVVVHHLEADDVVAAVRMPDGRLEARRWDVRTGVQRWRTVTEREVEGPVHGVWSATIEGAVLTVEQPEPLRLDVGSGAVLGPAVASGALGAQAGADDAGGGAPTDPRPAPVTDTTGPPLLLRSGADVVGVDPLTGEERWRRATAGTPLAQVDGLVVLREDGATVAVDAASGDLVWSVPTAAHVRFGPMLDGHVLLLPVRGASALSALPGARPRPVLDLVAVDPSDGLERWRAALPPGTFAISATPDGHVVVETTGGVVGLR
ncbi:outer membrane protein assembly factor BamB family protein [Actinotalea solisilvae]|uniref:outer membrane protein assembly factor BamB family protein n=1 Tax=Actinotalea solisilvae TaxID=2072922 RepID=UPI0018F1C849|nr:PQQ-binding-like beta-propeller repeat protein [Actinotalea solisilvae]